MISNLVNGKIYIGRTIRSPELRFIEHCRPKKSKWNKSLINDAIQFHGVVNFKFDILESGIPESEIDVKEEEYIKLHNSMAPEGYNCIERYSVPRVSEGTRKKMSDSKKGVVPWNKGTSGKQAAWNKGKLNQGKCKPITAVCMKTGEVKQYASSADAVREGFNSGHVTACCKGKLKHHKGYYWSYNKENTSE